MRVRPWPTDPDAVDSSGRSSGRWEHLLFVLALAGIVLWGFGGSWELPRPNAEDPQQSVPPGGTVAGARLFESNGCQACHSLDGERKIGPSLRGIFGESVELEDGSTVRIDEAYLVESIIQPGAKRVAGYGDAAMPSYDGLVSAEDALALVEFIKSLD